MRSRTRAVVLLGAIGTVVALAAAPAQAYVYWADAGPGNPVSGTTIGRADLNGSAAVNSFVSGAKVPGPIAVGAGRVYWGNSQTNSIGAANLNGTGANESFIPNATNATDGVPTALALDGTHLYWSDGSEYIGRANLDGSSPQPHFIDAGFNSFPNGIAVAGGTIYITTGTQIVRVPTSGGSPTPVVQFSGGALLISLAVANGYLYAAEFDSNTGLAGIARVQTNGSGLNESFIPNLGFPTGVATDGTRIYWVDHSANAIGRALLGTVGATNIQPNFVSDLGGPWGVAIDSLIDPTTTTISCIPKTVVPGKPTSCTATVSDSASIAKPTGTVSFASNGTTFFSGQASSCTLAPAAGNTASCTIGAVPLNPGAVPITASYSGDLVHAISSDHVSLCAGIAAQCGPPAPQCVVPKLTGKSVKAARVLLKAGHCALGKIKKRRHARGRLVVGGQQPAPGTHLPAGSKVAVRLVARRKHHG